MSTGGIASASLHADNITIFIEKQGHCILELGLENEALAIEIGRRYEQTWKVNLPLEWTSLHDLERGLVWNGLWACNRVDLWSNRTVVGIDWKKRFATESSPTMIGVQDECSFLRTTKTCHLIRRLMNQHRPSPSTYRCYLQNSMRSNHRYYRRVSSKKNEMLILIINRRNPRTKIDPNWTKSTSNATIFIRCEYMVVTRKQLKRKCSFASVEPEEWIG